MCFLDSSRHNVSRAEHTLSLAIVASRSATLRATLSMSVHTGVCFIYSQRSLRSSTVAVVYLKLADELIAYTDVLSLMLCAYYMLTHSLLKDIQEQLADGGCSKSVQSALQQSESSAAWQQLMKPVKLTCATVGSKGASNMVNNDTYTAAVMHM
jgi:hypothetical protein